MMRVPKKPVAGLVQRCLSFLDTITHIQREAERCHGLSFSPNPNMHLRSLSKLKLVYVKKFLAIEANRLVDRLIDCLI